MNKVVIVTGASRGIGAATAKKLAEQGYAVCVNYRAQSEAAHQVIRDIQANGGKAIAVQADVSDEQQVLNLFDATENALGSVTHLVNNVGILFTQSPLAEISLERFQKVMNTNVNSCFLCCREAAKRFSTGGAIVNVSSGASRSGAPFEYVDYATSKGAMDTLTKGLSLELADRNIRVNGVRPGFIYTDMHADGGEPNRVDRLSPQIPLKRGGTVEEVANAIAWLLSDEASYVTGSFIDLSGGK
ncbi:sugar dehydrogenase [Vibrio parahaemolyticus]|uniref:glucose 1-dehydrogenase n=1 Tax=Vibrio TaxID=662 RepID=UPI00062E6B0C|nr:MULTISPECIES: glucose 1-dehydrogenase [Vibrio]KOY42803.1 sugar dehydrogenase [Vibrio parahaemolyticus]PLX62346.1 MAG: 3-oxoacyl-ACP reductase [Vibrio alginolyticus]KLE23821.1 sugar dehydrogenase [Vibrio diabolicus]MCQ9245131.1 glucose 1-dehydrogenase [Vibrio diabolicus]MCS0312817.1 glucose 1-dehydrogenase [Vibrio diabolicus]